MDRLADDYGDFVAGQTRKTREKFTLCRCGLQMSQSNIFRRNILRSARARVCVQFGMREMDNYAA